MTIRLYSEGVQVFRAISKVRRAIVSHDANILSVIIKGSARLRRRIDLRMVPKKVDGHDGTGGGGPGGVKVFKDRTRGLGSLVAGFFVVDASLASKADRDRGVYTRCKALGFGGANGRRKRKTKDTERQLPADVH
jgi:hypothetical protein